MVSINLVSLLLLGFDGYLSVRFRENWQGTKVALDGSALKLIGIIKRSPYFSLRQSQSEMKFSILTNSMYKI